MPSVLYSQKHHHLAGYGELERWSVVLMSKPNFLRQLSAIMSNLVMSQSIIHAGESSKSKKIVDKPPINENLQIF